ncbi:hypothetical protein GCM10009555_042460 [Acrocarpospora macrocephala]|uniref:Uncharacterized protein n=1 Tax=Acrocarpospora macrocephala TaxID=150177 RepID=A0A5M3WZD3_9ACTN|nr:hypothetical protein Amac_072690 [Acrocarpospora macrocephala]
MIVATPEFRGCDGSEGTIRYSDQVWAFTEREEPQDFWYPCKTPGLPSRAHRRRRAQLRAGHPGGCDNSGWTNSGTLRV